MKKNLLKLLFSISSIMMIIAVVPIFPTGAYENDMYFEVPDDNNPLILDTGESVQIKICGNISNLEIAPDDSGWMIHESPYAFNIEDTSVAQISFKHYYIFSVYGVSPGSTLLTVTAPDGQTASMDIIVTDTDTDATTDPTVNTHVREPGDLNGDGRINVADLVFMQKIINKDTVYSKNADMNNDGAVDVFDMILLKRKILGL